MTATDPYAQVRAFLVRVGLLAAGQPAEFTPLAGGVSSDLLKVDLPELTVCVKSALSRLRVDREWIAPVSRNQVEQDWLRFAGRIAPGQVPRVLAHDRGAGLFAMEFLPPQDHPVWKAQLLAGHVDARAARAVGDLVGRVQAAGAANPGCRSLFATDGNFEVLRIEPYLRATARAHPDLAEELYALIATTTMTRTALAHGDVSPKNILIGPNGPVLLDAECAWFGDPAFDVAFCINHLLLKAVKLPGSSDELRGAAHALVDGHVPHVEWEDPSELDRRVAALVPALALARVDGTSPVEYLDELQRDQVRSAARALLRDPAPTVAEVLQRWDPEPGAITNRRPVPTDSSRRNTLTDAAPVTLAPAPDNPVPDIPLTHLDGFTHRWTQAGGVRLHAVEGGQPDGPVVVLLAGFPQTWWAWHQVMPTLAERFHVLAVDLPGQGHSERMTGSYDTHTVASVVHAAVTDLAGPTYRLIAHDIGAWVGFSLALQYEEHLRCVALLDAGIPGITLPTSIPTDPARAWKIWHFAFHLVPELPETLIAGRERDYVAWFLKAKALADDTFDDIDVERYAAALTDGGVSASLAYYRHAHESARRNHEILDRRHLTVPILGVSSSHGSIPDMAASIKPWADNTTGVTIAGAGHYIPDEQPGALAEALTAFLDAH